MDDLLTALRNLVHFAEQLQTGSQHIASRKKYSAPTDADWDTFREYDQETGRLGSWREMLHTSHWTLGQFWLAVEETKDALRTFDGNIVDGQNPNVDNFQRWKPRLSRAVESLNGQLGIYVKSFYTWGISEAFDNIITEIQQRACELESVEVLEHPADADNAKLPNEAETAGEERRAKSNEVPEKKNGRPPENDDIGEYIHNRLLEESPPTWSQMFKDWRKDNQNDPRLKNRSATAGEGWFRDTVWRAYRDRKGITITKRTNPV